MKLRVIQVLRSGLIGVAIGLFLVAHSPASKAQETGAGDPVKDIGNAVKGLFDFVGRTVGSILDKKGGELKSLIDAKKFEDAAAFYVANETDLQKSESSKVLLPRLAAGLGAQLGVDVASIIAKLDAVREVPPTAAWSGLRYELNSAESVLAKVEAQAFYQRQPTLKPAWAAELAASRSRVEALLVANLAKAFASYDHLNQPLFLDAYPAALNARLRSGIAVKASGIWLSAMLRGTEAQAKGLVNAYAPLIATPDARMLVSIAYADAVARARGWRLPRSLQQTLQLAQVLKDAGLDPSPATRALKIALVRGLNPAIEGIDWKTDSIGVPVQQISHGELANWSKEVAAVKPSQVYILLDMSRFTLHSGVRSVSSRSGTREVGQREEANPAVETARQELESARSDLNDVEQLDQQNQAQAQSLARQSGGSGFAALGAIAGSALSSVGLQSARDRVSRAEQAYQTTPRTIRKAVMQDYKVAVASVEVLKVQEVGVYVVDGASGRFGKLALSESARVESDLDLGVDSRDPSASIVESRNNGSRQRLLQFARSGMPLQAGEVWKRIQAADTVTPSRPVAELQKVILEDYKRWQDASAVEQARLKSAAQQGEAQVIRIAEAQQ